MTRIRLFHPEARRFLLLLGAGWFWVAALGQSSWASPGTVYLVVGSDTAIWNAVTTVDVYTRHPHYRQDSFTASNAPIFQVMDPAWRAKFKDSFGQSIKFTWWMMGGNLYRDADNLNVPVPNTMTLHLMQQYHGAAIRQFGDELSLHYHTFKWSDYNGTGIYYWNQTRTFNECRADFDVTVAQYFLEEGIFPISFRSGWHFMDADWQAYLNELIPYCFHDNYGVNVPWYTNSGPIAGVEDWSHAPSTFVPFHPSTNDYQAPGDGKGWNVRSVKIQSLTQPVVDQLFSQAASGLDQVACFWTHLPENFVASIAKLGSLISVASSNKPTVPFRYCTAVDAMQRWRGLTNEVPPELQVLDTVRNQAVTLAITSNVPIFQRRPFVCIRDLFGQYQDVSWACVATGTNAWSITLPIPAGSIAKVGIAVTDAAGNLASKVFRYVPDDLYLDDLDPQYAEGQGNWSSTTNAAWGIDARQMLLSQGSTAEASWDLPLSWSGRYRVSVQVPGLTNAATNIVFNFLAGSTNLLSVLLPDGIATNQWAFVGSVDLNQAVSNRVQLVVDGTGQAGRYALADVLRIVPAPETSFPSINTNDPVQLLPTPEGYILRFAAGAGVHYALQRSSALGSPWSTLQIATPNQSGVLEYEEEKPPASRSFYRIVPQ